MNLIVRYLLVAILLAVGILLIVSNHRDPSTPVLVAAGGSILLGGMLADPADIKNALATIAPFLPFKKTS